MPAGFPGMMGRATAAVVVLVLAAYPVRVFLAGPVAPFGLKLAWVACLALGVWRPRWGVAVLFATPLLPIWPHSFPEIPAGLVHLLVLSQAIPLLARRASGSAPLRFDAVAWAFVALFAVALVSAAVTFAGLWQSSFSRGEFAAQVDSLLRHYLVSRPGPGLASIFVALSTLGDGVLAYLTLRNVLPAERRLAALASLSAVAVAVAAFGIVQAYTRLGLVATWLELDAVTRVNATYTDPNALAAFFALFIPILCGLAAAAGTARVRLAWLAATLVLLTALVFTAGRMGYLATAVGLYLLAVCGLAFGLQRHDPWPVVRVSLRRVVVVASVVLALAGVAGTAVATARDLRFSDQSSYLKTVLYTLNLRVPLNERLKGRIDIWRTVGGIVRERPWFGTGVGTVYMQFSSHNTKVGAFTPAYPLSAHNTFLNVAAEMGLVGVASWLLLLGMIGVTSLRGVRREADRGTAWRRLGMAAGLGAFAVTMLSGDRTILREDVVVVALVAALATVWSPASSVTGDRMARRLALALLTLLAVTLPVRAIDQGEDVDLSRVRWGFHLTERDAGIAFEWTTAHATFYVPVGAHTLTLPMRALAPFPQDVEIVLNGRLADRIRFADYNWKTYRYVLPRSAQGRRFHRVELRVSPAWEPDFDGRTLGIQVGEISAE